MSSRDIYRAFCAIEPTVPIFMRPWWLDAACGPEGWDVAIVIEGERVEAALPYRHRRRLGVEILSQPPLTQFLGPWLREAGGKEPARLARQKDLMLALIDALPAYGYYGQNWSSDISNWLPFYWRGFSQTTQYTYVLPLAEGEDYVWQQLHGSARKEIRKATGRFGIRLREVATLDDFLALNSLTFERQGKAVPYSREFVAALDEGCVRNACRKIFIAEDEAGAAHAGAYIIWDGMKAYYLMGGGDPQLRNSGATSFCMWEAIRFAAGVTKTFDFEGSMIEPVERFFRSFGARQTPYFRVSRTPSPLLRLRHAVNYLVDRDGRLR